MANTTEKKKVLVLDKFHSELKGVALVPPKYKAIDFSNLKESDIAYLIENGKAKYSS